MFFLVKALFVKKFINKNLYLNKFYLKRYTKLNLNRPLKGREMWVKTLD